MAYEYSQNHDLVLMETLINDVGYVRLILNWPYTGRPQSYTPAACRSSFMGDARSNEVHQNVWVPLPLRIFSGILIVYIILLLFPPEVVFRSQC